jgi:hypothetical protein
VGVVSETYRTEHLMKATSTDQVIGTMAGHRAIVFTFALKGQFSKQVQFDFINGDLRFNGATYVRLESAALNSMIRAGYKVETFTHEIYPL